MEIYIVFFFFFSSRRRHTRLTCDWSSDVCSSDLTPVIVGLEKGAALNGNPTPPSMAPEQIGRASCRERVEISEGAGALKKKKGERGGGGRNKRRKESEECAACEGPVACRCGGTES